MPGNFAAEVSRSSEIRTLWCGKVLTCVLRRVRLWFSMISRQVGDRKQQTLTEDRSQIRPNRCAHLQSGSDEDSGEKCCNYVDPRDA